MSNHDDRNQCYTSCSLLAAIPDMVFEVDPDGVFLFVHARPGQAFADHDAIVGGKLTELLPQEVGRKCLEAVQRVAASQEVEMLDYSLPYPDSDRFFRAHLGPSTRGTVVAVIQDVTSDQCYQRKLEQQAKKLSEVNESLEQFVYVASHDLREPLTGIAGFASLLQRRYSSQFDETGQHFLDEIIAAANQLAQKIEDLLALSRAGRGNINGPFPLGSAIEEARRSLVRPIKQSGAAFRIEGQMPLVRGDRSMIAQIFQNLFSNSIKYRKGEDSPLIWIEAETDKKNPDWVRVSVRDNGIGFNMEHADRIFKVFQRLYTIEQYPGTGIGLAIAKKIVEKHGGRIWTSASPEQGATFYFTLPGA